MEGEYIIGAELDGQSISLEPGGQFELSGAPLETLHMTCSEVNNHLYQVRASDVVLTMLATSATSDCARSSGAHACHAFHV